MVDITTSNLQLLECVCHKCVL